LRDLGLRLDGTGKPATAGARTNGHR
jgi:hypothetical protein